MTRERQANQAKVGGAIIMRLRYVTTAALVFAASFWTLNVAKAGPVLDWLGFGYDPPSDYSPARYWTPGLAHLHDDIHGPKIGVYAPDRHPEIQPTMTILQFCQPAVAPAATIIPLPSPPPESRFRY